MKARLILLSAICNILVSLSACSRTNNENELRASLDSQIIDQQIDQLSETSSRNSKWRGWDYLVNRLRENGVDDTELSEVYQDARMPVFGFIPFKLRPRESTGMYQGFSGPGPLKRAFSFYRSEEAVLLEASQHFNVEPYVICALLLVESGFGANTGNELVVNRLSRLVGLADPRNVKINFEKIKQDDRSATLEAVSARAAYLEQTFLPELIAIFRIRQQVGIDPFDLRGSSAGAFGIPQFLPNTYLRFAVDADGDGKASLYSIPDAIWSVAHFLSANGWKDDLSSSEKRTVIWQYNRSDPYIDTVLSLARKLNEVVRNSEF